MVTDATTDGSNRRRASWSLKTIVENVAGKPITDFQDPDKPVHPYLQAKAATQPPPGGPSSAETYDPVGHLYPPLVGSSGRAYHGPEHEHHSDTLDRHPPPAPGVGERSRPPGPMHRPERLYLHYLLLHMDRLSDSALRYLKLAVEEEFAHRTGGSGSVRAKEPAAPPPTMPPSQAVAPTA